MKQVLLFSCVLALALMLVPEQQTADATVIMRMTAVSSCDKPANYKDCAAECDDLAECKKCCARGKFSDKFDKKCKDRCTSTFTMTVSVDDTSGINMPPIKGDMPWQ